MYVYVGIYVYDVYTDIYAMYKHRPQHVNTYMYMHHIYIYIQTSTYVIIYRNTNIDKANEQINTYIYIHSLAPRHTCISLPQILM